MKLINKILLIQRHTLYAICFAGAIMATGCKKYLTIPLPYDTIAGSGAYDTDKSGAAVLNSIYSYLFGRSLFDSQIGVGYLSGLYSDELKSLNEPTSSDQSFYKNAVVAANTGTIWENLYKQIYASNLVIEGVSASGTLKYKDQWLGEAYFLRAFLHFYVVNEFGDAVIATTTDYTVNNTIGRSPASDVYKQIVKDLLEAQRLLSDDFKGGDGLARADRGRPNKAAATALLARVYLYTGDWTNAEIQSGAIIGNTTFRLTPLAQTFLASSKETIWALAPDAASYVRDYSVYNNGMAASVPVFPASGVQSAISASLEASFEAGDGRLTTWTRASTSITGTPITYRFPDKYKTRTPGVEYIVLFRLAEQYLIRAEARAQLNKITGANSAQPDIDSVRKRASLPGETATSKDDMLSAIAKERRTELFTEEGHRLFDLRRTGKLDALMTVLTPQKGGSAWQSYMQWWPIPTADSYVNPNLKQTPGYK